MKLALYIVLGIILGSFVAGLAALVLGLLAMQFIPDAGLATGLVGSFLFFSFVPVGALFGFLAGGIMGSREKKPKDVDAT